MGNCSKCGAKTGGFGGRKSLTFSENQNTVKLYALGWKKVVFPSGRQGIELCSSCLTCSSCGKAWKGVKGGISGIDLGLDGRVRCQDCFMKAANGKPLTESEREARTKEMLASNLPNPFEGLLLLDAGERIHEVFDCQVQYAGGNLKAMGAGKALFTNGRVVYVNTNTSKLPFKIAEEILTLPYDDIEGIELFYAAGVSANVRFHMKNQSNRILIPTLVSKDYDPETLLRAVIKMRESALEEIARASGGKSVQVVMDFSWLKEYMQKGGLVLSTVKCPSCGGSLPIPESGGTVKCKYCGSDVKVTDIFEKVKQLIG